jgi:hypothetical protein
MAISFVGQTSANSASVTLPGGIQAGDLIVVTAFRNASATAPSLPSGWSTPANGSGGANTCSQRLGFKIAVGGETSSGTWTNATQVEARVYRASAGSLIGIGAVAQGGGAGTTVTYPALTLQTIDGSSWLGASGAHRSINTNVQIAPTGMVNRSNVVGGSAGELAGHDSNGVRTTNFTATGVSVGGTSSGWRAVTFEIREIAGAVSLGSTNDDGQSASSTTWDSSSTTLNGTTRVGFRFPAVAVPNKATISRAILKVEVSSVFGSLSAPAVTGVAEDNASAWSTSVNPFTVTPTTAGTSFSPGGGGSISIDVTAIVQEIVDRTGWASGNALAFAMSASGTGNIGFTDYGTSPTATYLQVSYYDGWTPRLLGSGIRAHIDASRIYGLADGASVSAVDNLVAGEPDFTKQGTGALTFEAGELNSLAVLRFANDGVLAGLNSNAAINQGARTVGFVLKRNGANIGSYGNILFQNAPDYYQIYVPNTAAEYGFSTPGIVNSPVPFSSSYHLALFTWEPSGQLTIRNNGQQEWTYASAAVASSNQPLELFRDQYNSGVRADLAEFVFAQPLDGSDTAKLEGYLAWKWGLQGTLPVGHPYKASAPPTTGTAGSTFDQSVSAAAGYSVASLRSAAKRVAVAANDNVAVSKGVSRRISTALSGAVSILKGVGRALGVPAATATLVSAAQAAQQFFQTVSASAAAAVTTARGAGKSVSGAVLSGAAVATRRALARTISATAAAAVSVARAAHFVRSLTVPASGMVSPSRAVAKRVAAAVGTSVALAPIRAIGVVVSAAAFSATLVRRASMVRLAHLAEGAVGVRKGVARRLSVAAASISQAAAIRAFLLTVSVSAGAIVGLARRSGKSITAPAFSAVAASKGIGRSVGAVATTVASLVKEAVRRIGVPVAGVVATAMRRAFSLTLTVFVLGTAQIGRVIATAVQSAGHVSASLARSTIITLYGGSTTAVTILRSIGGLVLVFGSQVVALLREVRQAMVPRQQRSSTVLPESRAGSVTNEHRIAVVPFMRRNAIVPAQSRSERS